MAGRITELGAPFRLANDLGREIDEAFARICPRSYRRALPRVTPPIELTREGDEYVIRLDVPGSNPEEIDISFADKTMRVRGSRGQQRAHHDHAVLHSEIAHGEFERVLELPEPLRPEEIKATYRHGVLEVRIRPFQKGPGRKVPIEVSSE
jgi:HSP20 family protein